MNAKALPLSIPPHFTPAMGVKCRKCPGVSGLSVRGKTKKAALESGGGGGGAKLCVALAI